MKARLIVVNSEADAKQVRAQAVADPEKFPALARQHSQDPASASSGGMMPPIRHYLGDEKLEQAAFNLKVDQISQPIPIGNQFVILKCEGHFKATEVDRTTTDPQIEATLKERKLRDAAQSVFKQIEQDAVVQKIFGDPVKQKQFPGLAAIVNERRITNLDLAEACVARRGSEVLDKLLDRKLLEQALRKQKFVVTQADIDAEIARVAAAMGQVKPDGKPDVQAWLELVTKQDHVTTEIYMTDAVWPSVALQKLVGNHFQVTDEDIKKGYEANYGPRARCRAIILNNQRKSQEVWEKARDNPTAEFFAKLAKEYSIDSATASLGGEVPPIARHAGQPLLEQEAFQLKKGEMSGVIQLGESFVILRCEGFTDPVKIDIKEAKKYIYDDLFYKKQRLAMAQTFERLQEASEVDNFLAGTIHHAKAKTDGLPGKVVPAGNFDPITGKGDKNDPDEIYKAQAEKLMAPAKRR